MEDDQNPHSLNINSDARFQTIYEFAPFMIDSFDKNGQPILWNNACAKILGYTVDDLKKESDIMSLFYPDQAMKQKVLETIAKPDGQFREFIVQRKDGKLLKQMWANFKLPDQTVISVGYDITEIRETQEKLEQINQSLEDKVELRSKQLDEQRARLALTSKFAALGEMAGGIAHEINNPLAIIAIHIEQLLEMLKSNEIDLAVFEKKLLGAKASIGRITKIISGLRAISRDSSRDPITTCNLSELVHEVEDFCKERFRSHDVKLDIEIKSQDIFIECRPVEIQQVLLNMLNNAFDAVAEKPDRWVKMSISQQQSFAEISILDSGFGIESSIQEKIFQPFYTTKTEGKGTGLGLSISRGIIEAHKGKISVDFKSKNTCFILQIPISKK
ncbi:MAG: ATP-binding protein [Oligoflexia bacterium]|nr:ATP-binding protein [Oligoflexia bacterium]